MQTSGNLTEEFGMRKERNKGTMIRCPLCGMHLEALTVEYPDFETTCMHCDANVKIWASPDRTLNIFGCWDRIGEELHD